MIITRNLEAKIEKWLFRGKVLIIYGPRQVGKTTLSKAILKKFGQGKNYFNCEIIHVRKAFEKEDPLELKNIIGEQKLIVLDEAQKIKNIGLVLKLFVDTYPDVQIIATGSSSFDLSNKVNEPLTGRAIEFTLYPFSISELGQVYSKMEIDGSQLEKILRFGSYPEVVKSGIKDARIFLDNLSSKYLYKDIFDFENLKHPDLLNDLLQLLAMQLGNEVSLHELAVSLHSSRETVARYMDLLKKTFVIFELRAFSRNLRKEISKKKKIYFYDLGVRNSILARYNPLELRDDVGALWENFCIVERLKHLQNVDAYGNRYFWRTHDQKEIDYIEEYEGKIHGYEFKFNKEKFREPKEFLSTYKNSEIKLINKKNYWDFVSDKRDHSIAGSKKNKN